MMKTRQLSFLFALCALIGLSSFWSSCDKKEKLEDLEAIKEPLKSPENPDNTFDYVGIAHNQGLKDLGLAADTVIDFLFRLENVDGAKQFMADRLTRFYGEDYNLDSLGVSIDVRIVDGQASKSPEIVLEETIFANPAKQHLSQLFSNLEAQQLETTKDVNALTDMILEKEVEILSDTSLTEIDYATLLSATSTLRHSINFWNGLLYTKAEGWNRILDEVDARRNGKIGKKLKRALCIAKWDAVGAVIGGVTSGVVGAVAIAAFNSAVAASTDICKF
jgi:hypothetical protein